MTSPFPGMDPYLEGYMWPDVHQVLATQIRRQLVPRVAPRYAVRLAVRMVTDRVPAQELGIIYPDVEVIQSPMAEQPLSAAPAAIAPASLSIALAIPVPTRLVSVEVRDAASNTLVTSIEILSPANKREPGLHAFMAKRDALRLAGVHVLEIDLIRRGTRPWSEDDLPETPYMAALIRANSVEADIWSISLRESLPSLPVPLRLPDEDVPLELQLALETIYAEAQYQLTLDYKAPPPPPSFTGSDLDWIEACVQAWQPT